MTMELAEFPSDIEFLSQVMREGNPHLVPCARRALEATNTRESQKALFDATHAERSDGRDTSTQASWDLS